MLSSQDDFSTHLRHSQILKRVHVKSKLRECEKLFFFLSSDSVKFVNPLICNAKQINGLVSI